jgi:prepilin-type N-terminal cleavage/methylation domain-containing protein
MNQKRLPQPPGFTLIELIIVITLVTFLIAGTYSAFLTGQSLWTKIDRSIELEDNLRKALDRIVPELAMSGHDKRGFFQVLVSNDGGAHGSDIVRFSIPVICQNNGNAVDPQGNAAHWGAPLTWGCAQASCMDADNNCDTVEYKYIEYLLHDDRSLRRRVLDYSQNVIREDVIASSVQEFQVETGSNQRALTLTLKAQTDLGGKATAEESAKRTVYLRNSR